jgi:hypothetical protein
LWTAERHRRALNEKARLLSAEDYSRARTCTYEECERLKEVVGQFGQHFKGIGESPEANPWFGYYPFKLIHGDEPAIAQMIEQLAHSAETLISAHSESRESTGLDLPATEEDLKTLRDQVRSLPPLLGTEALDLLPGIGTPGVPETLQAFERQVLVVRERMPELLRMLSAPLAVTQDDVDSATEVLREALTLNQAEAPLPTIQTRRGALLALAQELGELCTFIDETASRLGMPLQPAPQVVATVWAAVQAASLAPLDLLGFRRERYTDPTTLSLLDDAEKQARGLRQTKRTLEARFDMNLLPPREELVAAVRAFRTSGGLLRGFRGDWRRGVRTYRGISLTRRWFLRAAQCEADGTCQQE